MIGALQLTTTNLSLHLPYKRATDTVAQEALLEYLTIGDIDILSTVSTLHPDARALLRVVEDPQLRPVVR